MKSDARQRVEKIFAAALEIADPAERQGYLDHTCAGNEGLRQEVQSLLAASEEAGSLLQEPAIEQAVFGLATSTDPKVEGAGSETPHAPPRQVEILARKADQIIARQMLTCGEYVLGRSPACAVVIESADVSQMAPEQAAGRIQEMDERTDIYALGGILYNILVLRPPVMGPDLNVIVDLIRTGEIRPPSEYGELLSHARKQGKERGPSPLPQCPGGKVPAPLSAITMKALATRPADRYQSVADLQKDLRAFQDGFITSAEGASQWRVARLWLARHRVAFGVLSGLAILFATFGAITFKMLVELRGTAETFYDKATALANNDRIEQALPPIDYAIRLDSTQAKYHYLRGNILESLLKLEQAARSYEAALRAEPRNKLAQENLQLCEQLLRLAPGQRELPNAGLSELYGALLQQGRLGEAQTIARQLLARSESARKALLDQWRVRLEPTGCSGALTVDENGRLELSLRGTEIVDLSSLRGIPLEGLDLQGTKVTNLLALTGMPLNSLNIARTEISDLRPLKGMPLKKLNMSGSQVADLTPLAGMSLEEVGLSGRVKDIRVLAGMPIRHIDGVGVNDLGTLRTLPLEEIGIIWGSDILDLRPLLQFPKLRQLALPACKLVRDFRPLHDMQLTRLDLTGTLVSDLSPLEGMPLYNLWFNYTPVADLTPLRRTPLNNLEFAETRVTDLSPLIGMPLKHLGLQGVPVKDFGPLQGLKLKQLFLSNTKIADLSVLKGMPLQELWLDGCRNLRDVSPLRDFPQLETLTLPAQIKEFDFLRQLPSLKRIGFHNDTLQPAEEFWKTYSSRKR